MKYKMGLSQIFLIYIFLDASAIFHNNGKNHLRSFDSKSNASIFLGYSYASKAFRVFNQKTLNIEETVHVVFD